MSSPARCGTQSGYKRHRKLGEPACDECREAIRLYSIEYRASIRRITGPRRIDAAIVRRHLDALRRRGVAMHSIAAACGMKRQNLAKIASGSQKRVTPEVARRILAVSTDAAMLVDATGTRRRIHALAAIGWSMKGLSTRLGYAPARIGAITRQDVVTPETRDRIRALYDELSMTPGPSASTRRRALAAGWLPPLAWDDETIDDPGAWADCGAWEDDLVDDAVVERLVTAFPRNVWRDLDANREERIAAAIRLGDSARKIRADQKRLGYSDHQITAPSLTQIEDALGLKWHRDVAPLLSQEAS